MYNIHNICMYICIYVYIYLSKWKSRPKDLREIFKALDANGDGFLTVTELRDGIDKAPIKTTWWILVKCIGIILDLMLVKQCHKPSPSHHHKYIINI